MASRGATLVCIIPTRLAAKGTSPCIRPHKLSSQQVLGQALSRPMQREARCSDCTSQHDSLLELALLQQGSRYGAMHRAGPPHAQDRAQTA